MSPLSHLAVSLQLDPSCGGRLHAQPTAISGCTYSWPKVQHECHKHTKGIPFGDNLAVPAKSHLTCFPPLRAFVERIPAAHGCGRAALTREVSRVVELPAMMIARGLVNCCALPVPP